MSEKSAWQKYKEALGETRPWDLVNPKTNYANESISSSRLEICNSCEFLIPVTKQCKKCGCFMAAKTKLAAAACPLGKWLPAKNTNLVIIPSRDRVINTERVISSLKEMSLISDIMIGLDDDNESIYPRIDGVIYEVNPRLRMNNTLNLLANKYADQYETITFMGDDHLPRSAGWDKSLYSPIEKRGYGVSYGNDLLQGKNLPTAVMMSTNIIKALGFMSPPTLIHMFMDNFWKVMGEHLDAIDYFDEIIIEHMHAYAGKAELDEMYLSVNNEEVGSHDAQKYGEYVSNQLAGDVVKVKDYLSTALNK